MNNETVGDGFPVPPHQHLAPRIYEGGARATRRAGGASNILNCRKAIILFPETVSLRQTIHSSSQGHPGVRDTKTAQKLL